MIITKQPKRGFRGFCDLVPPEEQPAREKTTQENLNLRKKRWKLENPEKVKLSIKNWQKKHPERMKEADNRYYQNHKVERQLATREYRKKNPERVKLATMRWTKNNPDKVAKWRTAYRERWYNAAKILISKGLQVCACCGNSNKIWLQIDHVIPPTKDEKWKNGRSKRTDTRTMARQIALGKLPASDYQLLCANCNFAKDDLKKCPIDHSLDKGGD